MNKIKKFNEYSSIYSMIDNFITSLSTINEKTELNDDIYNKHKKDLISNFDINLSLLGNFSEKINLFTPIIDKLITNSNKIESNEGVSVLSSICIFFIICLEKENYKNKNEEKLTQTSKNLLEELKLRGVGNGVIKKLIKSLESIKDLIAFIYSNDKKINSFNDLIQIKGLGKILKAIYDIIDKNNIDFNNCSNEFLNIIGGVETVISKENILKIINASDSDINTDELIKNIKPKKVNKFDINSPNGISDVKNSEIIQEQ